MQYLTNNVVSKSINDNLYAGYVFPKSSPMRHLTSKW